MPDITTFNYSLGDKSGDVGPGDTVLCHGYFQTVRRVVIHPPHCHPDNAPIHDHLFAVEVVTVDGSRWVGGESAYVGGDLRVHWARA